MRRFAGLFLVTLAAGAGGYLAFHWKTSFEKTRRAASAHRAPDSRFLLNPEQARALPTSTGGLNLLERSQDSRGIWTVQSIRGESAATREYALGRLYPAPSPPVVTQALHYCTSARGDHYLDSDSGCPSGGRTAGSAPAGFIAPIPAPGFLLLSLCSTRDGGRYLSLNPRCESPEHLWERNLGAILAARGPEPVIVSP